MFFFRLFKKKSPLPTAPKESNLPRRGNLSDKERIHLDVDVSWCRYLENIDDLGVDFSGIYRQFLKTVDSLHELMRLKFHPTEHTYHRYQMAIDRTEAAFLDTCKKMIPSLKSLDDQANEPLKAHISELLQINKDLQNKMQILYHELSSIKNLNGMDESDRQALLEDMDILIDRASRY